jgi:hypothetical protein
MDETVEKIKNKGKNKIKDYKKDLLNGISDFLKTILQYFLIVF